jgi:hypothetical protein
MAAFASAPRHAPWVGRSSQACGQPRRHLRPRRQHAVIETYDAIDRRGVGHALLRQRLGRRRGRAQASAAASPPTSSSWARTAAPPWSAGSPSASPTSSGAAGRLVAASGTGAQQVMCLLDVCRRRREPLPWGRRARPQGSRRRALDPAGPGTALAADEATSGRHRRLQAPGPGRGAGRHGGRMPPSSTARPSTGPSSERDRPTSPRAPRWRFLRPASAIPRWPSWSSAGRPTRHQLPRRRLTARAVLRRNAGRGGHAHRRRPVLGG